MSGAHMYNAAVILSPSGLEQMAARKKPSRKKTTSPARKTSVRKKVGKKKVARKVAKKKASVKKKTSRKKVAKKKAGKKKVVRKKVSRKKSAKKKAVKKKVMKKPSKKRTSKSKVTSKTARKAVSKADAANKPSKKIEKKVTTSQTTTRSSAAPKRARKRKNAKADNLIHGIEPYQAKKGEEFMNDSQREHFRTILLAWKRELMQEVDRTVHHMQDEASNFPDPNDRATQESEFGLELRTRDRERKLLKKIASAIARLDDDTYGYCEETGEEIGLQRLEARPVATLSVEAQERRELAERQYSDRDD